MAKAKTVAMQLTEYEVRELWCALAGARAGATVALEIGELPEESRYMFTEKVRSTSALMITMDAALKRLGKPDCH